MRKKRFILPLTAFALLLSFGLSACNNGGGNGETPKDNQPASQDSQTPAKQEKINITSKDGVKSILFGETLQLSADQEGVTWESAKPEVATIDQTGLVTAVSKGSTTIKAKKDGFKDGSFSLTVDYPNITVTAADNKTNLLIGDTVNLSASEQGVAWSSSDSEIAAVENGVVTAKKLGSAVIKASKEHFNDGSITINVVRPEATATLSLDEASHYSPTGEWAGYQTAYETSVYEKEQASDGKCLAHFAAGCKETLTFTSDKAVKAEVTLTILARSSYDDLSACFTAKFNGADVAALAGVAYAGSADYPIMEVSLGEFTLVSGNNVLEINFLGGSPYLDDVKVYAEESATLAVVPAAPLPAIEVSKTEISLEEGATEQIACTTADVKYSSSKETVATVSETGLITAVAKGSAIIYVQKADYKTAKINVTVTEKLVAGEIRIEAESGKVGDEDIAESGTAIVKRNTSTGETCTAQWAQDAVLVVKGNIVTAGTYTLALNGRAGGQYGTSNISDLSTVIEIKVNGSDVTVPAIEISGRTFTNYEIGDLTLAVGEVTIEVKGLSENAAPNIDFFKLTPKAA